MGGKNLFLVHRLWSFRLFGNSMAVPVLRWIGRRIEQVRKAVIELEAAAA